MVDFYALIIVAPFAVLGKGLSRDELTCTTRAEDGALSRWCIVAPFAVLGKGLLQDELTFTNRAEDGA